MMVGRNCLNQSVILGRHELPRLVGGCITGPVQSGRWWVGLNSTGWKVTD